MAASLRYLAYGTVMMVLAIALAWFIATTFNFSWLVISMILLTFITIGLLTNVAPGDGPSGPNMHPNPWSGQTAGYTPQDIGLFEYIMREDRPNGEQDPVPADKRFFLMSFVPGLAMLVAIFAWIARILFGWSDLTGSAFDTGVGRVRRTSMVSVPDLEPNALKHRLE